MIAKIMNKIFKKEDIMRNEGEIYLRRWTLLRTGKSKFLKIFGLDDIRIYIHKFMSSDHTRCLHDHPNDLISFIFWNGYDEEYWDNKEKISKFATYKAPCLRKFPASHAHRVDLLNNKPAWSLVFMYKKTRNWGFWLTNTKNKKRKWVNSEKYYKEFGGNGGCE